EVGSTRIADSFSAHQFRFADPQFVVQTGIFSGSTRNESCLPIHTAEPMDDVALVAPPMSAASEVFVVELAEFSGPLDLLLSLIRDEQIDIYDIPIARIAEQFLARISSLKLDEAADYLEMAARLVRIKAQLLLPRREGEDVWEDPRAELVRRLLEYQQVREVVDVLERRSEDRRGRFARAYTQQAAQIAVARPLALSLP